MLRRFGHSLAVSGDTILIGAPGEDSGKGAAVTFSRDSDGIWQERQRLEASDGDAGDDFGWDVAVRGNTALVGARGAGAAYVFVKESNGHWRQSARLAADEGTFRTTFGSSVALHDCVAVVGAGAARDQVGEHAGPGFVYAYDTCGGATWRRMSRITDPHDTQHGLFASELALSASHLLVGSPSNRENAVSTVYSYVRTDAGYVLEQEIASPGTPFSQFGRSIQIRDEVAAIGAPVQDSVPNMARSGAVYVLAYANGGWTVRQKIQPQPGQQPGHPEEYWDHYGWATALDGDRLVVSAPFGGMRGDFLPGHLYVYERAGADFPYRTTLIGHEGNGNFGSALGLSGGDLIVGESGAFEIIDEDRSEGWSMGAAWAYDATRLAEAQ
jgi:FG-GAP repeat